MRPRPRGEVARHDAGFPDAAEVVASGLRPAKEVELSAGAAPGRAWRPRAARAISSAGLEGEEGIREGVLARVAILLAEMFEDSELRVPHDRLRHAGHEVVIVGLEAGTRLTGKRGNETVTADVSIADASADSFDAVVIPGGRSPARLRADPRMVAFVRAFSATGRPLAAVCHGPLLVAAAGVARGRTLTSWPAIQDELVAAGARWVDREVVEDGNLVTSRKPADLEAFSRALLQQLEARTASAAQPAPR